ncbi:MAG: hypothetical protein IGR93_03950 [Hydrococcus sp. C42_A2020_068]|uniref:hypothetical protein n=1 Tax=Pleurocapsa sp. PCC 7327 TaxID=118163 RepID=UPI00029FF85B|nr:hypothetical protein [Pleurocapsa sp. PCC 7327]AFY77886.1 hypothetical protein Ple7327_2602 [Pleurocapsa sp. PCC 7327]MBF2019279.1 hypothetical protein [Hydrococcus sp. C42_A2020_068]
MEKLIRLDESDLKSQYNFHFYFSFGGDRSPNASVQFYFDRDRCFLDRETIKHEGVFFINWFALELNPTRPLQILT